MISVQKIRFSDLPKENKQIRAELSKRLNSTSIELRGGVYCYYGCEKIFLVIKQMKAQRLNLTRNYKSTILTDISHIFFQNLSHLDVAQNHIVSLEPLIHLQAPNLKTLDLSENKILSLKMLRKLPFALSGLQIHLDGNPILELSYIEHIKFEKTAKFLVLDEFKTAPIILQGIVNLVKLEPIMLKSISLKKRINHSFIESCLKAKNQFEGKTIEVLSPLH